MNLIDYHRPAVLLYPSKMLYPGSLPLVNMLDALFKDAAASQRKLKVFWIVFFWLVTCRFGSRTKRRTYSSFKLMTASFSMRYFQSGCFLFSQDFQYFALPTRGRKTSREYLEAPMEMKELVYCQSASTGSIYQEVRVPLKMCQSYLNCI